MAGNVVDEKQIAETLTAELRDTRFVSEFVTSTVFQIYPNYFFLVNIKIWISAALISKCVALCLYAWPYLQSYEDCVKVTHVVWDRVGLLHRPPGTLQDKYIVASITRDFSDTYVTVIYVYTVSVGMRA